MLFSNRVGDWPLRRCWIVISADLVQFIPQPLERPSEVIVTSPISPYTPIGILTRILYGFSVCVSVDKLHQSPQLVQHCQSQGAHASVLDAVQT